MKCIYLNLYLLICIGIQATAYTVNYLRINSSTPGIEALIKSTLCLIWIVCCMVSMVKITRAYMLNGLDKNETKQVKQQRKINRNLYTTLLTINTIFASIAFGMTFIR